MQHVLTAGLVAAALTFAQTPPTGAPRTSGDSVGPYNKQIVDPAAATRGRNVYAVECVDCHGPPARGTANGHFRHYSARSLGFCGDRCT